MVLFAWCLVPYLIKIVVFFLDNGGDGVGIPDGIGREVFPVLLEHVGFGTDGATVDKWIEPDDTI